MKRIKKDSKRISVSDKKVGRKEGTASETSPLSPHASQLSEKEIAERLLGKPTATKVNINEKRASIKAT